MNKKNVPKFKRSNGGRFKRLKDVWRKPRGIDNKQRSKLKSAGVVVRIGYRTKREDRGFHPTGFREILVHNVFELKKVNREKEVARMAAGVGEKKRAQIRKAAGELGVRVLNA